ncbi:MAG TPA: DUF5615 family PIN-like protein [Candidatus Deferrimicrobium sp.]|nr:DUF5615 family PIN-like protein [Candidatus Deferrimicrobium sp.]
MRFLLDENVPQSIKRLLQDKGHSVITLEDLHKRGISNGAVAILSNEKDAIIITFDSDFLKLKKELENQIKAIYIKLHPRDPKVARELLDSHLNSCLAYLKKENVIILIKEGIILKDK